MSVRTSAGKERPGAVSVRSTEGGTATGAGIGGPPRPAGVEIADFRCTDGAISAAQCSHGAPWPLSHVHLGWTTASGMRTAASAMRSASCS